MRTAFRAFRALRAIAVLGALAVVATAQAAPLTLATWNIAWLRDAPLTESAHEQCRRLKPEQRALLEDRDPARWICRRDDHYRALREVAARVDADIFAFQEIEGAEALARILPREQYSFHVVESPWIQRVAFAVRRVRVEVVRFEGYRPLVPKGAERPRFGADLEVRVDGRPLRLLAVHLKSACHSRPLTDESRGPRDDSSEPPACLQLASQVAPLEAWIDARVRENVPFVVLGDFNRRFDAPAETQAAARDAQGRPLSIWREIDDDDPPGARLVRLTAGLKQERNCWGGDPKIGDTERAMFIDHIIVPRALADRVVRESVRQWPLFQGRITRADREWLRSLSDHCPLSVRLR